MILDEGVERADGRTAGIGTGQLFSLAESEILKLTQSIFRAYGDRPMGSLDRTDFSSYLLSRTEGVLNGAIAAYRKRQPDILRSAGQDLEAGFAEGRETALAELSAAGRDLPEQPAQPLTATYLRQTSEGLLQAEAQSVQDAVQKFLSAASLVASGAAVGATLFQALDRAFLGEIENGLTGKLTRDGRRLQAANYAEALVREQSHRCELEGESRTAAAAGISLVQISAHFACCPLCLPYQNAVLVDDVFAEGRPDGKHELLSTAIQNGLFHWNCRCKKRIYIPGGYVAGDPWNVDRAKMAQNYELEQVQREYERRARKYERKAEVALTPENEIFYRDKAAEYRAAIRELSTRAEAEGYRVYRNPWKERAGYSTVLRNPYGVQKLDSGSRGVLSYMRKGYPLSDGTVLEENWPRREVEVLEEDGYQIIRPADMDRSKQVITEENVIKEMRTVHPKLRAYVKEVQLLDYHNPRDEIFLQGSTEFEGSLAGAYRDKIIIWASSSTDQLDHALRHEAGHMLDQDLNYFSESEAWLSARLSDMSNADLSEGASDAAWVSEYASWQGSEREDFADSVALYDLDRQNFGRKYPARAEILRRLIDGQDRENH